MQLLDVRNVSRFFGGLHAVEDVSFAVTEAKIKAVIGPNGAGKTTLFNVISGTIAPTSGTVTFLGEDVTGLKPYAIARRGIFRTFQNLKLAPALSVCENVMVGLHTKSSSGFLAGLLSLPRTWKEEKHIRRQAMEMLAFLSLEDVADREAGSLPFGKQRAVELARALVGEPKLLLLDEPASGLNLHETGELSELILKIREKGVTVLLVEHDMSLVMDICDELVVLSFGKKIAEGTPKEIQSNPEVISVYLGEEDAENQEP